MQFTKLNTKPFKTIKKTLHSPILPECMNKFKSKAKCNNF